MRLLIDVVEKGKRRGQREDTNCGYRAEEQDQHSLMLRRKS
jgi:hypothetical protein